MIVRVLTTLLITIITLLSRPCHAQVPTGDEVRLKKCAAFYAHFEKGNIYDNELMIDLTATRDGASTKMTGISVRYGRYGLMNFPDSAFTDVVNPVFCEEFSKKNKPIKSSSKVLYARDKKQVYITILFGEDSSRRQVTWIVEDWRYVGRQINPI